jgi:tetratricopeptide (TPR) repeat protein
MYKNKFLLLVIALSLYTKISTAQVLTPEQVYENVCNSVLKINAYNEDNYKGCWGSAVVINESGIVVTSYHIFKGAFRIELEKNGTIIKDVKIIGAEPEKDILMLKIPPDFFPSVQIANSDSVRVGQVVYALGNPAGYDNTFTSGLITAIREHEEFNDGREIQFSASISHGSSGGALLNCKGELIGITAASIEKGQNMNFAIPINDYLKVRIVDYEDSLQVEAITSLCLGYNLSLMNNNFRAGKLYNKYLEVFPYDIDAKIMAGKNFFQRSQFDSAIAIFTQVIDIDPNNKIAFFERGNAYSFNDNDSINALNDYNKAIEIDSNYFDVYTSRAILTQYHFHKLQNSLFDINYAMKIKPSFNYLYFMRAQVLLQMGDSDKVIDDLYASIDRETDIAQTCSDRAKVFSQLGYPEDAIDDYTYAIKLEPDNESYYLGRAIEYSKCRNHHRAINDYYEVIKIDQYNSTAFNNMAYEYFHIDDYELATKYFKKTLKLDSKSFDSYLGLSIVCYSLNEIAESKKYIELARKIMPKIKKGSKGIEELEKLGYFWSKDEKEVLNEIFKLSGYN